MRSFQVDPNGTESRPAADLFHGGHAISLNPKKRCETIWWHLARPQTHPNEQFNFVVKGTLKVDVGSKKGMLVPAGSVAYFPAKVVHRSIATPDEDVVFFVVKNLSHGISGTPVDQRKGGAHFEPEVRAARTRGTTRKSPA